MSNSSSQVAGISQPAVATLRKWLERSTVAHTVVALVFVAMAARLFRLNYRYAVNIFFWDQWMFHNADLFQKHSLWQMFRWQYGPHRLGAGPLLSTLVEPHLSWNSRSESFLACSIVMLAAACALWLKKRLFGEIVIWDAAIPVLYLTATQYESLFITSNLAHGPLPLLLITLYCLGWTIRDVRWKYIIILGLNFINIYTGFALFLGLLTPVLFTVDYFVNLRNEARRGLYFLIALLVSGTSLVSFFAGYTLQPAVSCFSLKLSSPWQYVWYASLMFANFWIKSTGIFCGLIGCLAIVSLLWTVLSGARRMRKLTESWGQHAVAATLAAYSLLFSFNAAVGRLCLGFASAQSSRYMSYLALGLFGVYLHVQALTSETLRRLCILTAVVALAASIPIRAQDRGLMRYFSELKRNWRECYLSGGNIPTCDQVAGYKIDPEPEPVLQQKLDYLKRTRQNVFTGSD